MISGKVFMMKKIEALDSAAQSEYGRCEACCEKPTERVFNVGIQVHHLCLKCYQKMINTHKAVLLRELLPVDDDGKPIRIFLSGPMTGYPDYNFPFFNMVATTLKECGYDVVNPVDICKKYKKEKVLSDKSVFNAMIEEQQKEERTCTDLLLLPGWELSKGVRLELKTAIEKDMHIYQWANVCNW